MNVIIRQAIANLRSHRLQGWLIFITLTAASALLTLSLSTMQSTQGAYDRLFERTHGAHLWLYLNPNWVTEDQVAQAVNEIAGVEDSTPVMRSVYADIFAGGRRYRGEELREWPDEAMTVGQPLLVAGRAPQPGETNVIMLDRNWAAEEQVNIGEIIEVLTPAGRQRLTVIGLVIQTETGPYGHWFPIPHFLALGDLDKLGLVYPSLAETGRLNIGLRLINPDDLEIVLHEIQANLPENTLYDWVEWKTARESADSSVRLRRILLLTFSIIAGLAAGFLIANTIAEAVRAQTRQIGLLKVVGFTGMQLALIYSLEFVGLALVASMVGLGAGGLVSMGILRSLGAQFGEARIFPTAWILLITPLSALLIATLFTLWPVRHAARQNVVDAIRKGVERPRRGIYMPRIPLALAISLNDIFIRPWSTILTALGLGMAVVTLVTSIMLGATLQEFITTPGQGPVLDGDIFLTRTSYFSDAAVRQLILSQSDVEAWYSQRWASFQLPGNDEVLNAIFREGELDAFVFPLIEGRMLTEPDETIVGYGLASEFDLHPGDTMDTLLDGEKITLHVVGIYREGNNSGRMLILHMELMRRVRPGFEAFSYVLKLRSGVDAEAFGANLASNSNDQLAVKVADVNQLPNWLASLQRSTVMISAVLVGIAMIGVFNSAWLAIQKRQRELALLKAVGMTPGQVTHSVLIGAMVIAMLGYVIGLPVGIIGVGSLMDALARNIGFGPIYPVIDWLEVALLLPVIVLATLLGALIPARKAGRAGVVEMLRYE